MSKTKKQLEEELKAAYDDKKAASDYAYQLRKQREWDRLNPVLKFLYNRRQRDRLHR